MEVVCPGCHSRFNLPDSVKSDAKLRCSVCKMVFRLNETSASAVSQHVQEDFQQNSTSESVGQSFVPVQEDHIDMDFTVDDATPSSLKKKLFIVFLFCLLLLCGIGGAYYWWQLQQQVSPDLEEQQKRVSQLTMSDVRQYYVENDKAGKIFVIEGKVINGFPVPKDLIELEASICTKDKTPLQTKKILAGTLLSYFQLKVMSEKELDTLLSNKVEILANNTNVMQGAAVPFMFLFFTPPSNVAEFVVRIVDVQDSVEDMLSEPSSGSTEGDKNTENASQSKADDAVKSSH